MISKDVRNRPNHTRVAIGNNEEEADTTKRISDDDQNASFPIQHPTEILEPLTIYVALYIDYSKLAGF